MLVVDVVYDSSHVCWFSPVVCCLVLTPVYIADCVWPYRLHGCFPPLLLRPVGLALSTLVTGRY